MKTCIKLILISLVLSSALKADHLKLTHEDDTILLDKVSKFSVGEMLIGAPDEKAFMRNKFAEICVYGDNIESLKKFTGRHKNKRIKLSLGDIVIMEPVIMVAIDNGKMVFAISKKQFENFHNAMNILERDGNDG